MALKPDRSAPNVEVTDIRQHWSEAAAQVPSDKGGVASLVTQGSGVAMDASLNVVEYSADPSGAVPMGVLLQDVRAALSATRDYVNHSSLEARPGDKVTLVRKGMVVTDMLIGTPTAGATAFLGASGNVTPTQAAGAPQIGRFETVPDTDGFVRLWVEIA